MNVLRRSNSAAEPIGLEVRAFEVRVEIPSDGRPEVPLRAHLACEGKGVSRVLPPLDVIRHRF